MSFADFVITAEHTSALCFCSIQSETPFEGAYGNLKRLFDKAAKMYQQVKKQELKKLSPSRQRSKDIKRLLVSFMYLQSLLQPKNSLVDDLTSLCQSVLEDFNLVLFYLPSPPPSAPLHSPSGPEEETPDSPSPLLPDSLLFKMVVVCLMVVHSLKRGGSKQYSASIAFTLALFSHLVNHVNIRLQAELEDTEGQVPPLSTDGPDEVDLAPVSELTDKPLHNGTAEPDRAQERQKDTDGQDDDKQKHKKKYTRLSRLRRRRGPRTQPGGEDSDLSEGFDSDEEEEGIGSAPSPNTGPANAPALKSHPKRGGVVGQSSWDSGSEDEDGGTAFDVETDSDMNSQESRSDLEDMEESSERGQSQPRREEPPAPNGPLTDPNSASTDPSISSNLQAMSSQLFQAKRCFRLAPTFTLLLKPQSPPSAPPTTAPPTDTAAPAQDTPPTQDNVSCTANGTSDNDFDSDSEGSQQSAHSPTPNEKTPLEKMEILTNQGLLLVVKVFTDWLRTNTDIILMCAQSSQSLWNRLSVLLNLLPDCTKLLDTDLGLSVDLRDCLRSSEHSDLVQSALLPEDRALRLLPALSSAHRRMDWSRSGPELSPLHQCVVRVCCIRSFGHFLTTLQGNILHFNPEAGIFTSISQSREDSPQQQELSQQQAQAHFRMAEEEARRNRLMRDMAQLRLQLEVSQLEGSLQQPKSQLSMYLVPDTAALSQHLPLVRQLVHSGCFMLIIPRTVIDGLDRLKKETPGARDGIRFLEIELNKGNRYIRCQKEVGRSFERDKLKRVDIEAWHLYKMVDSCRQLAVSQSLGDEDTAGLVTILTGRQPEDMSTQSAAMKAALQAAAGAGMEVKHIGDFYQQWKEMG